MEATSFVTRQKYILLTTHYFSSDIERSLLCKLCIPTPGFNIEIQPNRPDLPQITPRLISPQLEYSVFHPRTSPMLFPVPRCGSMEGLKSTNIGAALHLPCLKREHFASAMHKFRP